jgi:hypothetical protein
VREKSWKAWQALRVFTFYKAYLILVNAQLHNVILTIHFQGVNWHIFYLPGIQTLPAGSRAKPSTHRMGDELLNTPRVPGHAQVHSWGALTVASSAKCTRSEK